MRIAISEVDPRCAGLISICGEADSIRPHSESIASSTAVTERKRSFGDLRVAIATRVGGEAVRVGTCASIVGSGFSAIGSTRLPGIRTKRLTIVNPAAIATAAAAAYHRLAVRL